MSCWVVPTLAAELWGVPLEQVMGEIRAGAVVSKLDYGFTLVDVAPDSRELAPPPARKVLPAPMTFVSSIQIEAQEVATELVAKPIAAPAPIKPEPVERILAIEPAKPSGRSRPTPALPLPAAVDVDDESEDGPDPNFGEPDDGKPLDWRAARARAATQRRRPPTRFN